MRRVLVVEDEDSIRELIALNLRMADYEVLEAESAEKGLALLGSEGGCDAAVLDVMLPGMNGFSLCEAIRRDDANIGIIILSAKSMEQDKIRGLSIGADDYMTKPFDTEELVARVGALTRRRGEVVTDELRYEDLTLDLASAELKCGGESVRLSRKEFEVLKTFLYQPSMTFTTDTIINSAWGMESDVTDNNVEVYISFLRKKLKYLKSKVSIKRLQKIGYRLEVD